MKKNLALWVAFCAVLGLTACGESTSIFENGEKRCDNNAVKIQNDGAWTIETTCEGTSVCNEMTHVCDAAAVTCDEGATACTEDGKLNSCADNVWTTSDCEADQVCPSGKDACEPIVCEGGNSVTNNVFVDGNIVWTRSGWPGNETENISQTNIDVSGSVDIRIETSQPLVTDNLKWMNNPLFSI